MKKQLSTLIFLSSLLLLQGCAAGLIAVAGTAVAVSSDERSISTQIDDDKLAMAAIDKVNRLNVDSQKMRISLITNNGHLLIIGQVPTDKQKKLIETELRTVKGVKKVYNELRVNKPIGFTQQTKDSWITTKVKSQLTADDDVNSFQVKVVTEDGELFLIGRVDKKTADTATNIARKIAGVKRVNRVLHIIPEKK